MLNDADVLDVNGVAAEINVDREGVTHLIRTGQLKAFNAAKNPYGKKPRWRIIRKDLLAFMEARSNRPASPPATKRSPAKPVATGRKWF